MTYKLGPFQVSHLEFIKVFTRSEVSVMAGVLSRAELSFVYLLLYELYKHSFLFIASG